MSVCFERLQELTRNDLKIFLRNELGVPINVPEIYYQLFYVDTSMGEPGVEIPLAGGKKFDPVNPSVGEYYAAFQVPVASTLGAHRIRWYFRQSLHGELQEVVQEFCVGANSTGTGDAGSIYSQCEQGLITRFRILVRDNCLSGREKVKVEADGEEFVISLKELWRVGTFKDSSPIKQAFKSGNLKILSVSPEGNVEKKKITLIHRFKNEDTLWKVTTSEGSFVATGGHKIFQTPTQKKKTEDLKVEDSVLSLEGTIPVFDVQRAPHEEYVYDLTVEDHHNFMLEDSKAVVSNSPDKYYNFAPPEQESEIGKYNRVFGYLFEDYEIITFLQMALEYWNAYPPETEFVGTLNQLCQQKPVWKSFIVWGAVAHAMFALSVNWIRNEFDYSIGGISLSIDRSSKYESMKSNAEQQFDKQLEQKMMTVKVIRGLRQPRFGIGVRSAFSPQVGGGAGGGVLTPRAFIA